MSDLKLATDLASLILDLHEKTLQAAEGGPERAEEWVKLRADYTSVCSTGAAVLAAALQDLSDSERGIREALERLLPFLDDLDEGADSIGVYPDTACSQECRDAVAAARAALSSKGEG